MSSPCEKHHHTESSIHPHFCFVPITGRKYCKWTDEETATVKDYFQDYFSGVSEKLIPGTDYFILSLLLLNQETAI